MRKVTLKRLETSDEGTFGELTTDSGFRCVTGELPWRDNRKGVSCIPPGDYVVEWLESPTKGYCYHVLGVPGRAAVEIHAGNYCGDISKGFKSDVEGCILPGLTVAPMLKQRGVAMSRIALTRLETGLNNQPFMLTVVGIA